MIIISENDEIPESFDLCIYPKLENNLPTHTTVNKLSMHLMPMLFPLIFPSGDLAWYPGHKQNNKVTTQLSALQYYSYRLSYRDPDSFTRTTRKQKLEVL